MIRDKDLILFKFYLVTLFTLSIKKQRDRMWIVPTLLRICIYRISYTEAAEFQLASRCSP